MHSLQILLEHVHMLIVLVFQSLIRQIVVRTVLPQISIMLINAVKRLKALASAKCGVIMNPAVVLLNII